MENKHVLLFFRISLIFLIMSIIVIFFVEPESPEYVVSILSLVLSAILTLTTLIISLWKEKHKKKSK